MTRNETLRLLLIILFMIFYVPCCVVYCFGKCASDAANWIMETLIKKADDL